MSPKLEHEGSYSVFNELREIQDLVLIGIATARPLSSREIGERALTLTLTDADPSEKQAAFEYMKNFGSHGKSRSAIKQRLDDPKVLAINEEQAGLTNEELVQRTRVLIAGFADRWWASIEDHRKWFRAAVESIISNSEAARGRLRPEICAALDRVVAVPRVNWNGRESTTDIYYMSDDIVGLFGYSLTLMLDVNGEISKALKKCKLQSCGRLFLSFPPPTGGPRTDYCDPEHKLMADKLTGAERTARWREKKRRQLKKKRRRAKT